jgi:hypothetical protein
MRHSSFVFGPIRAQGAISFIRTFRGSWSLDEKAPTGILEKHIAVPLFSGHGSRFSGGVYVRGYPHLRRRMRWPLRGNNLPEEHTALNVTASRGHHLSLDLLPV